MGSEIPYARVQQSRQDHESTLPEKAGVLARARERWAAWTENTWLIEIVSTVLGILSVVALVLVLRHYDGRQAPQFGTFFGSSLTLNTVTSILSTVAKATLLVPVAECIGQLKWLWFVRDPRPLDDLAKFDKASRGILGGVGLLMATKARTFAVVGAVLMVYGLAMDPLSQQLVLFHPDRTQSPVDGTVPISTYWNEGGDQSGMVINGTQSDGYGYSDISTGMKGAIQTGLYSGNVLVEDTVPSCPTQNCTFPSYSSLAVCPSFANITSSLFKPPDVSGRVVALSNATYLEAGTYFFATSASVASKSTGRMQVLHFNRSVAFKDVPLPLADVLMIIATYPDGGHPVYSAIEFILQWCVQEYTTEVVNGTAKTVRTRWTGNFSGPEQSVSLPYAKAHVGLLDYTIESDTHESLSRFLNRILHGHCTTDYLEHSSTQQYFASSDAAQALAEPFNTWQNRAGQVAYSLNASIKGTGQTGLEFLVNNIATGMTNYMRSPGSSIANGTMYYQEIVVKVRWKWFAAHGAFIVLCLLLLVSTIISTHLSALRSHAWKSSASAVLHALSPALQQEAKGISTVTETGAFDQKQLVRLSSFEDEGWRLVPEDAKLADERRLSPTS